MKILIGLLFAGLAFADDTAAIQALVNACSSGGTILFTAGTYQVATITLKDNCTYSAVTAGTVQFNGSRTGTGTGSYPIFQFNGNASGNSTTPSLIISKLTFDGGGINFNSTSTSSGISIFGNTFQNITNTDSLSDLVKHSAVSFLGSGIYAALNVTFNAFTNLIYGTNTTYGTADFNNTRCLVGTGCSADWGIGQGIGIVAATSFNFSDNTFDTIGSDAIKVYQNFAQQSFVHPGPYHIDRNVGHRIHRMLVESQDGYSGFCVQNKTVSGNTLFEFITPYYGSFGLSLMDWCTTNSSVTNNVINMVPAQGGDQVNVKYGIGIESGMNLNDSNTIRDDANNASNMISVTESNQTISNNVLCGPNSNDLPVGNPYYTLNVNGNPSFIPPTLSNNVHTATCAGSGGGGSPAGSGPSGDDFTSGTLNSTLWTFQNPAGGSMSISSGALNLVVPAASNHDTGVPNNSVRLTQNIGTSDFDSFTKFTGVPSAQYSNEGLTIWQDSSNYMRFELYSDGTNTFIYASTIIAGTETSKVNSSVSVGSGPVWLEVTRSGNTWTLQYSTNGTSYTSAVSFTQAYTTSALSLIGANFNATSTSAPAFTAVVDYFHVTGPDLTITKSHSGSFSQSGTGSYTVTVTNSGTSSTSGAVTMTDQIPTGLTATSLSGTGWTCVLTPTVNCTRSDALAASASYPAITVNVSVANNAAATVTNTVNVVGGGENNISNNTANDPTTINPVNPVSFTTLSGVDWVKWDSSTAIFAAKNGSVFGTYCLSASSGTGTGTGPKGFTWTGATVGAATGTNDQAYISTTGQFILHTIAQTGTHTLTVYMGGNTDNGQAVAYFDNDYSNFQTITTSGDTGTSWRAYSITYTATAGGAAFVNFVFTPSSGQTAYIMAAALN